MINYVCHNVSICFLHTFIAKGTHFFSRTYDNQALDSTSSPAASLGDPLAHSNVRCWLASGRKPCGLPWLSGGNCSTSQFTPWKKIEKDIKRPNHPNPMDKTMRTYENHREPIHIWYDMIHGPILLPATPWFCRATGWPLFEAQLVVARLARGQGRVHWLVESGHGAAACSLSFGYASSAKWVLIFLVHV